MAAAMRLVAGKHAPAVLSTDVKHGVRHEAMSFVLAGIVASLVLATFKVCACLAAPPCLSACMLLQLFFSVGSRLFEGCNQESCAWKQSIQYKHTGAYWLAYLNADCGFTYCSSQSTIQVLLCESCLGVG